MVGYSREFEVAVARLGETPLKVAVHFIDAAKAYQCGDFTECTRVLKAALKSNRQSFSDHLVLNAWIVTIEGRSFRLIHSWQT